MSNELEVTNVKSRRVLRNILKDVHEVKEQLDEIENKVNTLLNENDDVVEITATKQEDLI